MRLAISKLLMSGLVKICPECNGSGKNKYGGTCGKCNGSGSVPAE